MSNWTLFSNHGHVLVCLAGDSEARLRDVAANVGITERAVQKIVRDLQDSDMISISKHGRRNRYRIHSNEHLRHNLEAHCTLGQLVGFVSKEVGTGQVAEPHHQEAGTVKEDAAPFGDLGHEPAAPTPTEEKSTESEQNAQKPRRKEPKKPAPKKPKQKDSVKRQQGSLF